MRTSLSRSAALADASAFDSGWCALDRLDQLVADGEQRVQRRQRVLEDIGDAPRRAAALMRSSERGRQVLVAEHGGAADDDGRAASRHQPHERQGGDRLAGTGFADDAEALALARRGGRRRRPPCRSRRRCGTRCAGPRTSSTAPSVRLHAAAAHRASPRCAPAGASARPDLRRGSSTSRTPSPSRLMLITSAKIIRPGMIETCGAVNRMLAALAQHGAEVGLRRLGAEPEEGQAGGFQDHPADGGRHGDDDDRQHVGQHFAEQDLGMCDLPERRAASTNSRRETPSVMPRMLRAKNGMLTTAMA